MLRRQNGIPALPTLLHRKMYKTGQTRGADDDSVYQNRVSRSSTVLIPYRSWKAGVKSAPNGPFCSGYIVLVSPLEYIELGDSCRKRRAALDAQGIGLGERSLVFYQRRNDWNDYPPSRFGWTVATSREPPFGGQYVARVANTTSDGDERINHGFTSSNLKGAGIRVYEYADPKTTQHCRDQLEAIFWHTDSALDACVQFGMASADARARRDYALNLANDSGLLDKGRLRAIRAIDAADRATCPLCLNELNAFGFFTKLEQAEGREVHDLTVTSLNLFHVEELRIGIYNHRPYNLAWGCHHCNVVTKDAGIQATLTWMENVLRRNGKFRS